MDVPILLYVHTVPTYGREACERKAMNQWNSNLEVKHSLSNITIQAPLLEICQEIALKLHCEKAERMYHGQFATRHTFAKKKGQQLCESVKWKQPARTDVQASGRLHVGKGFLNTLDELSNDVQNAIACRWMQLQLQWLWKLFPSDFTWICVTGTCLDEKSLTLLCALLGQIFGSELDHWSWKRGRLALTF